MQQKTYDFLVKVKVPCHMPGFDMLGEAIDYASEKIAHNIFPSLCEIEEVIGKKLGVNDASVDAHLRRVLMFAEYRSGEYPNKELVKFGEEFACNTFSPKKVIYAAARKLNYEQ